MPAKVHFRPRVGVPWRTASEEAANQRATMENYLRAVERAGGDPVLVSLGSTTEELQRQAQQLDAFVLSGSPADVDPAHFEAKRHPATADADAARERTDFALLEHAMAVGKPVLAICYGIQSLNVFLGGTLIQDIPSEIGINIRHDIEEDPPPGAPEPADPVHEAQLEPGHVLDLSGKAQTEINSSHHQSVLEPGLGLRITARAPDGVVEAVEWTWDENWVVGVQWHPERMPNNPFAQALFSELIAAARKPGTDR
jgi:putative glutamine amidotransferase